MFLVTLRRHQGIFAASAQRIISHTRSESSLFTIEDRDPDVQRSEIHSSDNAHRLPLFIEEQEKTPMSLRMHNESPDKLSLLASAANVNVDP